jgi:hypothetical protein
LYPYAARNRPVHPAGENGEVNRALWYEIVAASGGSDTVEPVKQSENVSKQNAKTPSLIASLKISISNKHGIAMPILFPHLAYHISSA